MFETLSSSNIANNIKAEAVHVSILVAFRNDISKVFMPSMESRSKANAMPFIQAASLYFRGSVENISNNPPVNNIIANAMQIYILVNTDSIAIMNKRAKKGYLYRLYTIGPLTDCFEQGEECFNTLVLKFFLN